MERPQVRQIDAQHVESEREVTGWEAEELLRKYGYDATQYSTRQVEQPQHHQQVDNGLTFEEMVAQQEDKFKREEERRRQIQNGPRPSTYSINF